MSNHTLELCKDHLSLSPQIWGLLDWPQTETVLKISRSLDIIDHSVRVLHYLWVDWLPFQVDVWGLSVNKIASPDVDAFVTDMKMVVISTLSWIIFWNDQRLKDFYSLFLWWFAYPNRKVADEYSSLQKISGSPPVFWLINRRLLNADIPQKIQQTYNWSQIWYLWYDPRWNYKDTRMTQSIFNFPNLTFARIYDYLCLHLNEKVTISQIRNAVATEKINPSAITSSTMSRLVPLINSRTHKLEILPWNSFKLSWVDESNVQESDKWIWWSVFNINRSQFQELFPDLPPYFDSEKYTVYGIALDPDEFIFCCFVWKQPIKIKIPQIQRYLCFWVLNENFKHIANSINEKMRLTPFSISQIDWFSCVERKQPYFL